MEQNQLTDTRESDTASFLGLRDLVIVWLLLRSHRFRARLLGFSEREMTTKRGGKLYLYEIGGKIRVYKQKLECDGSCVPCTWYPNSTENIQSAHSIHYSIKPYTNNNVTSTGLLRWASDPSKYQPQPQLHVLTVERVVSLT